MVDNFLYIIGNNDQNMYKVGISNNPLSRIKGIQTGCPFPLSIIKKYKLNGHSSFVEKKIHSFLEKVYNSVLENYYSRGLLDIRDKEINSRRYWAGQRFEKVCHRAGLEPKITARLEEFIGGSKEEFVHRNIDAHSEFHIIIKEIGKFWDVLWLVIVSNKPAKKRMDEFREALDRLILYYDM